MLLPQCKFVKLRIVTDVKWRKIVSCAVTWGRVHDSPVFQEMIKKVPDGAGCVMLDAGYVAHENYKMIRNTCRRPVICTCKNHTVRDSVQWQRRQGDRKRILKSLKIRAPKQHGGVDVLIAQVQVYCSCSYNETGNTKTAATPHVRLLQPAVLVELCKKYVLCIWRMLYNSAKSDTRYTASFLPRENSAIYRKSKAIKCR